ncbi:MAG: glycoside hydrolase family 6 protein [Mycobacteriaceae bacterium]
MRPTPSLSPLRRTLAVLLAAAGLAAVAAGSVPTSAEPVTATAATTSNPLAGRPWGVYQGPADQAWQPYVDATGTEKTLLGYIALAPKAKWFGNWISNDQITDKVRTYVANSQAGNPDALVQLAIFRVQPWEHDACKRLPTAAEQTSYKRWIDNFAKGVGDAHVAIIQQPDGPFALCAPGGSKVPSSLVAYGTRVLSALPNTSVYVEVGANDWPHAGAQGGVAAAVKIAVRGGVKYARGIALNGTHYSSTSAEIGRGAAVVKALAAQGITGKHVVINTAESGHPFVFGDYTGSDPDNAFVCSTKTDPVARTCVTLGIPPTTDVANARWHLSDTRAAQARKFVDGYMWFGRPWLYRQADPFVKSRALQLVRTSPYSPYS